MSAAKTIGVATSDALRMLATPITTLKRGKLAADLAVLAELAKKHEIKALAIGLAPQHGRHGGPALPIGTASSRPTSPTTARRRWPPCPSSGRTSGSAPPPSRAA